MEYSLSYRLGGFAPRLDPDAAAYIAAVETALSSSITADQKNAINDFFKTGKSDGWYSSIKRLYLPIWADAAANAIDMVTRTSGTFTASGVTHATGYVEGDGSTGYFDMGATPSTLGITTASGSVGFLAYAGATLGGTRGHISCSDIATNTSYFGLASVSGAAIRYTNSDYTNAAAYIDYSISTANQTGIIVGSRFGGDRFMRQRKLAGVTSFGSETEADTGTVPTAKTLYAMGFNYNGTPGVLCDSRYGAWFVGLGLSPSDTDLFSLALKDLWETASGLTLP